MHFLKNANLNLGKLLGKYFAMSLTVATFVAISPALLLCIVQDYIVDGK